MKIGIEIHQQLATKKLFCNCPSILREDDPDGSIVRRLRAVSGESGVVDRAAEHEMLRGQAFKYEFYNNTTCLVEMDEEPPHDMNEEALYVTLQMARLLRMKVLDRIQVMRKIVIDGSNTSGFQRTALVARDGLLDTSEGTIRIDGLYLEEDAAKIVSRTEDTTTYRLDRLGIPLIEIGTAPDITSPQQAKEAALKLGMLLRSTGKAKRGIGTIRQDLNLSVPGGNRVEIKGAQELKMIPVWLENEARRQERLIALWSRIKKSRLMDPADITTIFSKTQSKLMKGAISKGNKVIAFCCKGCKGLFGEELLKDYRFGTELSGLAKAKAGIGGIIHSDELPAYGITPEEITSVSKHLNCSQDDAFVIILSSAEKAAKAFNALKERLTQTVPNEVRRANPDGTSTFLRPMPGAARMYPETDIPLVIPQTKGIELPEMLEDKSVRYEKQYGLSKELASLAVKEEIPLDELTKTYRKIESKVIVDLLVNAPREIKRRFSLEVDAKAHLNDIFPLLNRGELTREGAFELLLAYAKGEKPRIEDFMRLKDDQLAKEIGRIVQENKGLPFNALVGKAMQKLRGRAEGKKIVEALRKRV
ncbi:MAG: Glu-tRNA(Gln) amidotransferase subunit GatE [Nanoarchaeota archaeon]|nr:Glu-tRNA(Gln) amidotransferase subunit GatE [Nanoarchaeota archaeon]